MEYLIGALGTVFFLLCLYAAYKAGQRSRKPVLREVDEEQVRKAQRLRSGFEQLMGYDVSKAIGKR
ncbi:hypothetical protein DVH26_07750 [Paenibacillus sp. H1-7]|nr:hypothetical protein DVH26_07750 [Paenibacillus sp. H1-7]